MALLLALARNIPQAHAVAHRRASGSARSSPASSSTRRRSASSASAASASSSPQRARGFGMRVVAFDPFVGAERYRELGVEKADDRRRRLRAGRLHHAPPAEDARDRGLARRRGVRQDAATACASSTSPAAALIDDAALKAALDSRQGRRRRARRVPAPSRSPTTRCSATPTSSSRRTSAPRPPRRPTAPATRPPSRSSPRSPAASSRPRSTSRRSAPRTWRCSARSCRSPRSSGASRRRSPRAARSSASRSSSSGRIAERDTRLLDARRAHRRRSQGRTEEEVNLVNAPTIAEERGIVVEDEAHERAGLQRPGPRHASSPATSASRSSAPARPPHRPHLLEAWGQRFNLQLEPHLTLFRYRDLPGMIGRVGTIFGAHGINISSAAVGHAPDDDGEASGLAVDGRHDRRAGPARRSSTRSSLDGFVDGRTGCVERAGARAPVRASLVAATPSSTRSIRGPFRTPTATGSATCAGSRRGSTTSSARRRRALAVADLSVAAGRLRLRRRRLHGVDPRFGTLADFDALIAAAHERGLRVLMDLVPCHTSIEHPWFREHPDCYVWADGATGRRTTGVADLRRLGLVARPARPGAGTCTASIPSSPTSTGATPRSCAAFGDVAALLARPRRRRLSPRRDRPAASRTPQLRDDPPATRAVRAAAGTRSTARSSTSTRRNAPGVARALAALRAAAGDALLVGEVYLPAARGWRPTSSTLDAAFALRAVPRAVGRGGVRGAIAAALALRGRARRWVLSNHDFPRLPDRVRRRQRARRGAAAAQLPGAVFVYQGDEIGMGDGPGADRPPARPRRPRRAPPPDALGRDAPHGGFTTGDAVAAGRSTRRRRNVAQQAHDPRLAS